MDISNFTALCNTFRGAVDLNASGPPAALLGKAPTLPNLKQLIEGAADSLPLVYKTGYVDLLLANLSHAVQFVGDPETLAGVVYDHQADEVRPQLQRFLATVSDLYESFLSKSKRALIQVPLIEQLPPLATFRNSAAQGPFTIPADDISKACTAQIGLVSIPASYRDHPVLWASLCHETGGHDVVHANLTLEPELANGVLTLFGGGPLQPGSNVTDSQLQGLLWAYWMDEAIADVYGLLNAGPAFAFNLAAFLSTLLSQIPQSGVAVPNLRTASGADERGQLDVHPTDILRIHLAIGVIERLAGLNQDTRNQYIANLQTLAQLCAGGTTTVTLSGTLLVLNTGSLQLDNSFPLDQMQQAARQAGGFIATAKLQSLNNHSIQDIETWDDPDEAVAQSIAGKLKQDQSVAGLGDDAQMFAGSTLALLDDPSPARYASVTQRMNEALDLSFADDPVWGRPTPEPFILLPRRPVATVPEAAAVQTHA